MFLLREEDTLPKVQIKDHPFDYVACLSRIFTCLIFKQGKVFQHPSTKGFEFFFLFIGLASNSLCVSRKCRVKIIIDSQSELDNNFEK